MSDENLQADWQLSKECVRDRIQTLLKTSQWSDCTFQVGERTDFVVRLLDYKLLASKKKNSFPIFLKTKCY
jgi:hypothetical protein